jgi:hypothetical protein
MYFAQEQEFDERNPEMIFDCPVTDEEQNGGREDIDGPDMTAGIARTHWAFLNEPVVFLHVMRMDTESRGLHLAAKGIRYAIASRS